VQVQSPRAAGQVRLLSDIGDTEKEQKTDEKLEDKHEVLEETKEQVPEEREQSANHGDEEPTERNRDEEDEPDEKVQRPSTGSRADDDDHDYMQLVETPSLRQEEQNATQGDDSLFEYRVDDRQDEEDRTSPVQPRPSGDYEQLVHDEEDERRQEDDDDDDDRDEVADRNEKLVEIDDGRQDEGPLVQIDDEDQLIDVQQPPAADPYDDDDQNNNLDDDDDKFVEKVRGDDDDSSAQQQRQNQNIGYDDLI